MKNQIQILTRRIDTDCSGKWISINDAEKLVKLVVYDFLDELTNDDTLGAQRNVTIKRLASKWGVLND